MYVIRWNHSGDPVTEPRATQSRSSYARSPCPTQAGALRAGVAEDFPNGGGNRAYLFKVDGPAGRFSWLFQDSASAVDLREPIVVDGKNYGAPLDNLSAAMQVRGPRFSRPVDRHGRTRRRGAGAARAPAQSLSTGALGWAVRRVQGGPRATLRRCRARKLLAQSGVQQIVPTQYMDRWRLDRDGGIDTRWTM